MKKAHIPSESWVDWLKEESTRVKSYLPFRFITTDKAAKLFILKAPQKKKKKSPVAPCTYCKTQVPQVPLLTFNIHVGCNAESATPHSRNAEGTSYSHSETLSFEGNFIGNVQMCAGGGYVKAAVTLFCHTGLLVLINFFSCTRIWTTCTTLIKCFIPFRFHSFT